MPGEWVVWSTVDTWKHMKTNQLVPKEFVASIWTSNSEELVNNFMESHTDAVKLASVVAAETGQMAIDLVLAQFTDAVDITCDEITSSTQLESILSIFRKKQLGR
jgi:hypothetical protein